jgi:hypothetical protein
MVGAGQDADRMLAGRSRRRLHLGRRRPGSCDLCRRSRTLVSQSAMLRLPPR